MTSGRIAAIAGALALTACSTGTFLDDADTLWGSESVAEEEEREAVATARTQQVPVQSVRSVEIGRTRDGFLITAFGTAPGLGYSLPRLRARRDGAPGIDGYVEYDFVASEPPAGFDLPPGTARTRTLRADRPVPTSALRGARGIRVVALRGAAQIDFGPPPEESEGDASTAGPTSPPPSPAPPDDAGALPQGLTPPPLTLQ